MTKARDIMTKDVACCGRDTTLADVARMMRDHDCGAIPVCEGNPDNARVVGIVTDRDICMRAVADGKNAAEMNAGDVMTDRVVTVSPEDDLETCCNTMEDHQIRRVPVVDEQGRCRGIVAQADVALETDERHTAEVVTKVSRPTERAAKL